jgi:hypothetical protein
MQNVVFDFMTQQLRCQFYDGDEHRLSTSTYAFSSR